jgi:hypothetical protein
MWHAWAAVACLLAAESPTAAVGVLSENRVSTLRLVNDEGAYRFHLSTAGVVENDPRRDSVEKFEVVHSDPTDRFLPRCAALRGGVGWALFPGAFVNRGVYQPHYHLGRIVFGSPEEVARANRARAKPPTPPERFAPFTTVTPGASNQCVDGSGASISSLYQRRASGGSYDAEVAKNVRMCLRPIDDVSCLAYVLSRGSADVAEHWPKHERTTLFVVHCAIENTSPAVDSPLGKENGRKEKWRCTRTLLRSIELEVLEPFEVVRGDDRDYLFFAHSGLFVVDGKADTARPLRLPEGELVQAIVHDTDRGDTGFAFTQNRWFEVKLPLEYHEFELEPPKPDDPLPTLLRAAREVRKLYPAVPKADKSR